MNFLRSIDIFGQFFFFQISKKEKLNTVIGGILTVLMLLISFSISFLFGKDFYYRTNPVLSVTQISPEKIPKYKLSNKNLTIAYRLEDDDGKFIDFGNNVFVKAYFQEYKVSNFYFNRTTSYKFKVKKCSEVFKTNETVNQRFVPDDWFCLDFSELQEKYLGGNFNVNEDMSQIYLTLDSCNYDPKDNSTNYDNETLLCRNATELDNFFDAYKKKVFLNFLFPQVILNSDDLNSPIVVSPYTHFKKLDYVLTFEEYCKLDYFEFLDDQGWIMQSENKHTFLKYNQCSLNAKFNEKSSYTNDRLNTIYELNLIMNKVYSKTRREYMKIQGLFAITGGFISFLRLILSFLSSSFNKLERNKILVDFYFGGNQIGKSNCNYHSEVNKRNKSNKSRNLDLNDTILNADLIKKFNKAVESNRDRENSIAKGRIYNNQNSNNNYNNNCGLSQNFELVNITNKNNNNNLIKKTNEKDNSQNVVIATDVLKSFDKINENLTKTNYRADAFNNDSSINRTFMSNLYKNDLTVRSIYNNSDNNAFKNNFGINESSNIRKDESNIDSFNNRDKNNNINNNNDFINISSNVNEINFKQKKTFAEKIKLRKLTKQKFNFDKISIFSNACGKLNKKKQNYNANLIKLFNALENKILCKIDIMHYLKYMKYVKMIKNVIFNSNQQFYIKKFYANNINSSNARIDPYSSEEEMIRYFEECNKTKLREGNCEDYSGNINLKDKINCFILDDIDKNIL